MVINYFGKQFFKVQFGSTTIAVDPISKDSGAKPVRFGADICLITNNHPDCNGVEQTSHAGAEPFIIKSPGEYEIKEVYIKGFLSSTSYGGREHNNVIYTVTLEGMNLCFLGSHLPASLDPKIKESIDDIDILFLPIGGEGMLDAANAYKLAVSLEPKVIIPSQWKESTKSPALTAFLKEGSVEKPAVVDKLTIKKKDILDKEAEIIVLEPAK